MKFIRWLVRYDVEMEPSKHLSIGSSSKHRTIKLLSYEDALQIVKQNTERKNAIRILNPPYPPRLTPAPFLRSNRFDAQTPHINNAISWIELYDEQIKIKIEMKQQLVDKQCELDTQHKATLNATNETMEETILNCNQLKSDLSNSQAKLAEVQVKLAVSETGRTKSHSELIDLRAKLVTAEAGRELMLAELNDLRAKVTPLEQNSPLTVTTD